MQPKDFSIVVCAGGKSRRFLASGAEKPKQLVRWNNRPLILHTLDRFNEIKPRELALVVPEDEIDFYSELLAHESFPFRIILCPGGARRQDSVRHGLMSLKASDFVGIHDGARPFLSDALLIRLLKTVESRNAVVPALPVVETLKEIGKDGEVLKTLNRNSLVRVQTPQFFKRDLILEVHQKLSDSSQEFTDDAAMCEFLGYPVFVCEGDPRNIKITVQDDLRLAGVLN